ncbi:MAG: CvpA family protein [Chloroflexota bacterium]|nr:CvpA family protein [Chloroflexota bacterium]
MTLSADILIATLGIGLAILFGLMGTLRGGWREAVVSASIVIAALISEQWSDRWAGDIYSFYSGLSQGWIQFLLSAIILVLVVLVLGYTLGGALQQGPVRGRSRTMGLVLGLLNGTAVAGWLLRYIYVSLDNAQPTSPIYASQTGYGFMVWSGWYPVALAVLGGIFALVAPLRRAQVVVSQPNPASNWQPAAAVLPAMPPQSVTSTATRSVSRFDEPTARYNVTPAAPNTALPNFSYSGPITPPVRSPEPVNAPAEEDAPSTTLLPLTSLPGSRPPSEPSMPVSTYLPSRTRVQPDEEAPQGTTQLNTAATTSEPAWLMQSSETRHVDMPVSDIPASNIPDPMPASGGIQQHTSETCPRCGSTGQTGAFCTSCGNKLR